MSINWKNLEAEIISGQKLVPSYRLLLRPIERRVPLENFANWRKQLVEVDQSLANVNAPIEDDVRVLVDGIAAGLLRALNDHSGPESIVVGLANPWGSAVALLTLSTLVGRIGGVLDPIELDAIWPQTSQSLPEAISQILDCLYHGAARQKPAGPLAFYELARVAILNRGLFASVFGKPVGNYLGLVKALYDQGQLTAERAQDLVLPTYSSDDRCIQFVIRRIKKSRDKSPPAIATPSYPPSLRKYIERQSKPKFSIKAQPKRVLDKVRILLLGESRAGKSTIVKQLYGAITRGIDVGIVQPNKLEEGWEASQVGYASQTMVPIVLLKAKYVVNKIQRPVPCEVIDHRGGILSDPRSSVGPEHIKLLADQTGDCDLVIIVLPADQFDSTSNPRSFTDLLQTYVDLVGRILHENPFCMIAIAYSKSDEYGLETGRYVRIIDGDDSSTPSSVFEAFARFRRAPAGKEDELWSAFVALASKTGIQDAAAQEVSDLRRFLLNYTASLWKQIVRLDQNEHTLMNGYLVAALPAENMDDESLPQEYIREVPRQDLLERGFLQIFADFSAYMDSVWSGNWAQPPARMREDTRHATQALRVREVYQGE